MPREQLVQDLTWCDLIFHSFLASLSKAVGGLCCNARSLTGIFTLAQNMGSAVHRWLQAWNMDPSRTWKLLLRTWNQNIISNSSLFFCQTHLHCRRGVGVVGASQKTCRFHWIRRKSQAGAILRGVWGWGGYHSQFIADGRTLRSPANKMWLFENPKKYMMKESKQKKKRARGMIIMPFPII